MECQKCKKVLSKKGSHFQCQGPCQGTFHKNCVKGLAADMKSGKTRIYCNNCEEDDSSTEDVEEEDVQLCEKILKDIQKKVSALPSLIKQLDSITQSMSVLSDKYDTLLEEQEHSKTKIIKLENTVTTINNKCVYLEKCNVALEQKIHEFEQSTRKHNIEIVGIEEMPGENIKDIVTRIGNTLGVHCDEIDWSRRNKVNKQNNKPSPIVIGFKTSGTNIRDTWLVQRKKLVGVTSNTITGGKNMDKIYINEDLTKTQRALLWNTKKQLHGIYKYIWVTNGKILVKKVEGDKSVWIRSESDISDLLKVK